AGSVRRLTGAALGPALRGRGGPGVHRGSRGRPARGGVVPRGAAGPPRAGLQLLPAHAPPRPAALHLASALGAADPDPPREGPARAPLLARPARSGRDLRPAVERRPATASGGRPDPRLSPDALGKEDPRVEPVTAASAGMDGASQ